MPINRLDRALERQNYLFSSENFERAQLVMNYWLSTIESGSTAYSHGVED